MITTKLNLWRTASAVAVLSLAAACQPAAAPEQQEAPAPAASNSEAGESGAEHGEAGVAAAFAGLEGPARTAMRLQQLKGFVLVAQRVNESATAAEAGALVGQGLLEVYDPAKDQFGSFDPAAVRAAEAAGGDNKPKAQVATALASAEAAIDQAQGTLGAVSHADLAARMLDVATGLYGAVIQPEFNDPTEYQHSLGAALAAKEALVNGEAALRAQNRSAYEEAVREMDRFIALWPGASVPDAPTPNAQVLAQASRVRLALSSFLRSAE